MTSRPELAPPEPRGAARQAGVPSSDPTTDGRAPDAEPDLSALPLAGLTRRRMLVSAIVLAVAWLGVAFVRQVGDVTAASARADALAAANRQLAGDIAGLDAELRLIQRQAYIVQQARAYRLGSPQEVPFTLQKPLPALGPNAPGSAASRIGAVDAAPSPLESWLLFLFGPSS